MAEIHVNKKTFFTAEGLYGLSLEALDTSVGVDKNIFVYKYLAGGLEEFSNVASVVDLSNVPTSPTPGVSFIRKPTADFEFDSPFKIEALRARLFSDISALEKNVTAIDTTFVTDRDFVFSEGAVV